MARRRRKASKRAPDAIDELLKATGATTAATGGAGAKPPSLRSIPSDSPVVKDPLPVDATASGQGNPASAPPAANENAPAEEKPAQTDTRGRPKRKP